MLAFVKLLITFSISMCIKCVIFCLSRGLSRRVGALQISNSNSSSSSSSSSVGGGGGGGGFSSSSSSM